MTRQLVEYDIALSCTQCSRVRVIRVKFEKGINYRIGCRECRTYHTNLAAIYDINDFRSYGGSKYKLSYRRIS